MGGAWKERVAILAAALWWGSLTTTGVWVVPMLFAHLPTPAMAGQFAARLFTAQTWVALGCGFVLMVVSRSRQSNPMAWAGGAVGFVLAGVLLALLAEFAVAPRIVARQDLKLWHTVGSAMYLVQWVCAAIVLYRTTTAQAVSRDDGHTTGAM